MIQLCVEKYCQNCTGFEAEVEKHQSLYADGRPIMTNTYIYCERKEECKNLMKHLQKETEKENAELK